MYNNINSFGCQEGKSWIDDFLDNHDRQDDDILFDESSSGRRRPWHKYKKVAEYIAFAYDDVDPNKAVRVRDCSSYLGFVKEGDRMKLHDARFCRVRLCPVCQWRRSLKTYAQMRKVLEVASGDGYEFLFLTLTVKNCAPHKLSETLTSTLKAFNRLTMYKAFKMAYKGFYRGFEVTYNQKENTFHPHIHCILAVNKSYFSGKIYLSQAKLTDLWQKALKADYKPIVNIKRCYGDFKSVAEACKYAVKASSIIQEDWDLTVELVRILDAALDRRRFIGLGGIFKEIHKRLNLDDMEDGDLTHVEVGQDEKVSDEVIYFFWNGFNYYRG